MNNAYKQYELTEETQKKVDIETETNKTIIGQQLSRKGMETLFVYSKQKEFLDFIKNNTDEQLETMQIEMKKVSFNSFLDVIRNKQLDPIEKTLIEATLSSLQNMLDHETSKLEGGIDLEH